MFKVDDVLPSTYLKETPGFILTIISMSTYNSAVVTVAIVVLVCLLEVGVASSAIYDRVLDDATESAIVAQTNRLDRLTSRFQSALDKISSIQFKNKKIGNEAKHLIDTHLKSLHL